MASSSTGNAVALLAVMAALQQRTAAVRDVLDASSLAVDASEAVDQALTGTTCDAFTEAMQCKEVDGNKWTFLARAEYKEACKARCEEEHATCCQWTSTAIATSAGEFNTCIANNATTELIGGSANTHAALCTQAKYGKRVGEVYTIFNSNGAQLNGKKCKVLGFPQNEGYCLVRVLEGGEDREVLAGALLDEAEAGIFALFSTPQKQEVVQVTQTDKTPGNLYTILNSNDERLNGRRCRLLSFTRNAGEALVDAFDLGTHAVPVDVLHEASADAMAPRRPRWTCDPFTRNFECPRDSKIKGSLSAGLLSETDCHTACASSGVHCCEFANNKCQWYHYEEKVPYQRGLTEVQSAGSKAAWCWLDDISLLQVEDEPEVERRR